MENLNTALLLMVVGMATVFAILLIVIYLGKGLVLLVNKYLASSAGRKAILKLKNPPPFKPKKQKKPGMFAQMMAGSGGQGMPPM